MTGFGILGHANNLASNQVQKVSFEITTLPIIAKMKEVNEIVNFNLIEGRSAETSGGLLLALPAENAHMYCAEFTKLSGYPAWVVGKVVPGDNTARILNPSIIEVDPAVLY